MYGIMLILKTVFDKYAIIVILLTVLFSLLIDAPKYRAKGFFKECKIVRIFSYLYIIIGIMIFIFLKVV
ncbi:CLC_0170 family protein [Tepidimicrobium xylanilyticum]|uniref:Uncharacterized protein n=1 Tax=Tepidimicrobium xylanilyticum TaxID=1123352 RepID=A0A1H2WFK0_9FIRM|nr:CLC_0170 family protein [Tepidimicrobium xylanilyticum]SDW79463.1 hypothetical protein SAMN05660923_01244 [Tepidimicrobium xylanilyticum]